MTIHEAIRQAKEALEAVLAKTLKPGAVEELGMTEEVLEDEEIEIPDALRELLDLQTQCEQAALGIRMWVAENGVILSN